MNYPYAQKDNLGFTKDNIVDIYKYENNEEKAEDCLIRIYRDLIEENFSIDQYTFLR